MNDIGAWALASFNPDLKKKIFGYTTEEEKRLGEEGLPPNRKLIGRWLNDGQFGAGYYEIYKEKDMLYLRENSKILGERKRELVEKGTEKGRRFEPLAGSSAEEHWLITPDGDLEVWDDEGLIFAARKID